MRLLYIIPVVLVGLAILASATLADPVQSDLDKCEAHTYYIADGSQCVKVDVSNTGASTSNQTHTVTFNDQSSASTDLEGGQGTTFLCFIKTLVAHEKAVLHSTMTHEVTPVA